LLKKIAPDLLHAHYASGYGTLGRLGDFHPYMLSVWGSDIYDFPNKSAIHRKLLVSNLTTADLVCSTSRDMSGKISQLCPQLIDSTLTSFGVDTRVFTSKKLLPVESDHITVGTVKALAHTYGIDILIEAFAKVRGELFTVNPGLANKVRLLIVGGGPDQEALEVHAKKMGIDEVTTFVGQVDHDDVPDYLRQLDVYIAMSRQESFGVAILEASACARPVVVSDVGGLPEVVVDGETGFIVPSEDVAAAAKAILCLVFDPSLRIRMGQAGRKFVQKHYDWNNSVIDMEAVYAEVLAAD